MHQVPKEIAIAFLVVSFLGFLDAAYLTIEHYRGAIPPCTFLQGCEKVTTSEYSVVFGVPVALGGSLFYFAVFVLSILFLQTKRENFLIWAAKITIFGLLASFWFLYLQFFVIGAICIYCMFSVVTSTTLFVLGVVAQKRGRLLGVI